MWEQRNDLYRRVPLVEYYQNPLTRVHLIFWNKTPHPVVSGSVRYDKIFKSNFLQASKHFNEHR